MTIRHVLPDDLPALSAIWNEACVSGDVLYAPLDPEAFSDKFLRGEGCDRAVFLVAEENGQPEGFLHLLPPLSFRGSRPGIAYLTSLFVSRGARGQGLGTQLLESGLSEARRQGAEQVQVSSVNPINFTWRIPGTPGHDHNNMPGADTQTLGYDFLSRHGLKTLHREMAMYLNLSSYTVPGWFEEKRRNLLLDGTEIGPWREGRPIAFEGMCERVNSPYWHDVLKTELEAWRTGKPNADSRFWPDGRQPEGPRPLLVATHGNAIVGFTGPVDLQASGRGWFTGICTDPLFSRRGIGTVLFHTLMQAFCEEGASFSSLFTGVDNPAQHIYLGAGFRSVRTFALMGIDL